MSESNAARPRHGLRRLTVGVAVVATLATGGTVGLKAYESAHQAGTAQGPTLSIYSSLPEQGALSGTMNAVVQGEQLALDQAGGRAGNFNIRLVPLDDSTRALGNYDGGQCLSNAQVAASDPTTIGYIGDYNSGCSEEVIPTLNKAGDPQISPANTYPGLTTSLPGTAPGEPGKYYPTGKDTYFRTVGTDAVQAGALLEAIQQQGITKIAIANDGTPYGAGLTDQIKLDAAAYGVTVVDSTTVYPYAPNYRAYAGQVKASGAKGFIFAGTPATGGNRVTTDVGTANPELQMFFPDGMASASFTDPAQGGVSTKFDDRIHVTSPTLPAASYPGGASFEAAFKAKFGVANPDPAAIQGYAAMQVFLKAIGGLGAKGNNRAAVVAALHSQTFPTAVGNISFNAHGDTNSRDYGLYTVRDGQLVATKTLAPQHVLGG